LQLADVTSIDPQETPHAPQLVTDESDDSQPLVSGAVFVQST
jgi:hypothetical protein